MARFVRQAVGMATILWIAALIVLSYSPGFLAAAPDPWPPARLDAADEEVARREVLLWVEGTDLTWRLTGADVALRVDRVATQALAAARTVQDAPELPMLTLETWRIRSWIRERVAGQVRVDPVPARLDAQGRVIPDRPGRRLDQEAAVRLVEAALLSPAATSGPVRVKLPVVTTRAELTAERLEALGPWTVLASFTTRFDPADTNRAANIHLSAALLDGALVEPGYIFSFNDVVGLRTEERGFKPAPIIVSRRLVAGIGGGVCQLSSTTYNAALLSGLEVVERRNHSIPVSYLPMGRDATVLDRLIDLRFRNTLDHPIVIHSRVEGDRLTVVIWGHPSDRRAVDVRTRVIEELPAPVVWEDGTPADELADEFAAGRTVAGVEVVEPGRPGYVVEVERVYYGPDGKIVQVEKVSRDVYLPEPRKVRRLPGATPSASGL